MSHVGILLYNGRISFWKLSAWVLNFDDATKITIISLCLDVEVDS